MRHLNLVKGDELYVELDIEGAEFDTLKKLLSDGSDVLPFLKEIWIEWHSRYASNIRERDIVKSRS